MNTAAETLVLSAARPGRERLVTALIFALLAHGLVILGVGFVALVPRPPQGSAVNVTLVTSKNADTPSHADYLAKLNQLGPGNTDRRVPPRRTAAARNPFANPGFARSGSFATVAPGKRPGPREVASTVADSNPVASGAPADIAGERPVLLARLTMPARRAGATLSPAIELPRLYGPHPESDTETVNARAALVAPYLFAWQNRIERIGTAQFGQLVPPDIARGHLTLAVTLASDGSVHSIEILKRSRHQALDAAALKIIRLSAPFPPFPQALRAQTATLTFTYRWHFIRGGKSAGTVGVSTHD